MQLLVPLQAYLNLKVNREAPLLIPRRNSSTTPESSESSAGGTPERGVRVSLKIHLGIPWVANKAP